MEEQVARLLADTQSAADAPRKAAEQQLLDLYPNEAFPFTLCAVAAHTALAPAVRQAALLALKNFVLAGWSPEIEEFKGRVLVSEQNKSALRDAILALATSDTAERKVQNAASYVVSKIASCDYPYQWSGLLDSLLLALPESSDARVHGALMVLSELVEDALNEDQFFHVAPHMVGALFSVASNQNRQTSIRALAVSVFKGCVETLDMVIEEHKTEVIAFAEEQFKNWMPLFIETLRAPLPERGTGSEPTEDYKGTVAFKLQAAKVLVALRSIRPLFPVILAPQTPTLFTVVWEHLKHLESTYNATYIHEDVESRLEDSDGLPYTLDFLVLEELDLLQVCIRSPPVKKHLEQQLRNPSEKQWVMDFVSLVTFYAQMTAEQESMWEFDVNVFLSEETSVTSNYTARTACGDLATKLVAWLQYPAFEDLQRHVQTLFESDANWKIREAALYILGQMLGEWQDLGLRLDGNIANGFLRYIQHAAGQSQDQTFLHARAILVAAMLCKSSDEALQQTAVTLLQASLELVNNSDSDVVKASSIRALQLYLEAIPRNITLPFQTTIIATLSKWLAAENPDDLAISEDVSITFLETLRDTIVLDTSICLSGNGLDLLFNASSHCASNLQVTALVEEVFEEVCGSLVERGPETYFQLCERVLPSLSGAFDVANLTEENALTNLAAEMLSKLTKYAPNPLPANFVPTVMPRLERHILHAQDDELLKACTVCVRNISSSSPQQLFEWHDDAGASGLEVCLKIVDRLLSGSVDDNAAAEVGGLAASLVEHAGSARLGPFMPQLLRAVAARLASAEQAALIQSLILVFARLALASPAETIDFLAQTDVPPHGAGSGLHVVLSKWLENSVNFVGAADIRLNVRALAELYAQHDPRVAAIVVKGDLVVPEDGRIVTRSRARKNPDQYRMVPAPVKMVKVLVDEMGSGPVGAQAVNGAASAIAGAVAAEGEDSADEDEDDEWEDEPDVVDLGLGSTKAELMAFAGEGLGSVRQTDDETQEYLLAFFRGAAQDGRFREAFEGLNEGEKAKLEAVLR